MTNTTPLFHMIQEVRNSLSHLKHNGCTGFDCSPESLATLAHLGAAPADGPAGRETLAGVRADLGDCTRCPLCHARTHIVFGEGNPKAQLVFVGEGPGFDEDQTGHPFVGAAGQLLTKIIEAMGLSREMVYIGNIVKCRPPNNRNPAPGEIRQCLPFLKRQLAVIRPRVLCLLGNVAARALLEADAPISRIRGTFQTFMGIPVMPTFHPAYLLRSPEKKREVWSDIQQIMKVIESSQGS